MIERSVVLSTIESVFAVRGWGDAPLIAGPWGGGDNPLVELSSDLLAEGEFWIQTGHGSANALVTTRVLDSEPAEPDEKWEDVVALSFSCLGPVMVTDLVENDPSVPLVDGPGEYRLRVSAVGRLLEDDSDSYSDNDDDVDDDAEPVEFYLLEVWPAPPQNSLVVRQTSSFSRHQTAQGEQPVVTEAEAGLAASVRVGRDVDRAAGARTLSGATGAVEARRTVRGTRRRLFVECAHATSWSGHVSSKSSWIWSGAAIEEVGRTRFAASRDHADQLTGSTGAVRYSFLELDKPRRVVRHWNWVTPPSPDTPYIPFKDMQPLLARESTLTFWLDQSKDAQGEPWTEIKIRHEGLPVEWLEDMTDWWNLQLAIADHAAFGLPRR